jgi:predicted lipid-binding transport protein (Tim44 family)
MHGFKLQSFPRVVLLLTCAAFLLPACQSDRFTEREKGALIGSGIGAGTGAIIGHQTGHAGAGTAIGAGAGALAGGLIGESQRRTRVSTQEQIAQQQYGTPQGSVQTTTTSAEYPGELHTKYNPKTGQTFPGRFDFDPKTGEALKPIQT